MKNLFGLNLYTDNICNSNCLAKSKTNSLELVELYTRQVNTGLTALIDTPYGAMSLYCRYNGQFRTWYASIYDSGMRELVEFYTLDELVEFVRQYLKLTQEEYNAWAEEVI